MKKIFAGVTAALISVSLAGCASGPREYKDVNELKDAYVSAGGDCAKPKDIDTSAFTGDMVELEGMTALSCTDDIGVFVFKSTASRDAFVTLIEEIATASKTGVHVAMGEKWIVAGVALDNTKFAKALGGTPKY